MKAKTTKRALLLSVLSLLVCIAMLIGTTYAWFTDSVTTGVNSITSGTLSVDIVDESGATLENGTLYFRDANGRTDILWEPGACFELDSFRIVNTGNLHLKYKVELTAFSGDTELLDVIDFTVNNDEDMDTYFAAQYDKPLAPKEESELITIKGTMREEAGNEYMGKTLSGMKITVVAAQLAAEYDSFDNTYDSAADYPIVSLPVSISDAATEAVKVETEDAAIEVPADLQKELADDGVTSVTLVHTEPKVDTVANTITFDSVELVDQNGKIIDLEQVSGDITVVLPAGGIANGETVTVLHDGEIIATTTVADGKITYTAPHLCEVRALQATVVATEAELTAAINAGKSVIFKNDITISEKLSITKDTVIYGFGNTLSYGKDDRVIDVPKETAGANLTVKDLTVNVTGGSCNRGINYNTNGTLTLDNFTLTGKTTKALYGINLPSSSNGAKVEIVNSDITGYIALNIWGKNVVANVTDSKLSNYDPATTEDYSAVVLNDDGTTSAEGTVVTITGGSVIAKDENGDPCTAFQNATDTGSIVVSNSTNVVGKNMEAVAAVRYKDGSGNYYNEYYGCETLQDAIDVAAKSKNAVVVLNKDITLDAPAMIEEGKTVVLDLNGCVVTAPAVSFPDGICAVWNKGNLTIQGNGTVKGDYAAVYSNGNLTVNGGSFESSTGFGLMIDNIYGTVASVATINGGTFNGVGVYNPAELTVNGGTFNVGRDPDGASDPLSDKMTLFINPTFTGAPNTATVKLTGGTFNGDIYVYDDGITETSFTNNGATITGSVLDNA